MWTKVMAIGQEGSKFQFSRVWEDIQGIWFCLVSKCLNHLNKELFWLPAWQAPFNLESSDPSWSRSRIFAQIIPPCCMQLMLYLNSRLKTSAHKLWLLDLWWGDPQVNCWKFCSPFLCHVLRSNQESGNKLWRWLLAHDCHCLQLHFWKFYHHVACKL